MARWRTREAPGRRGEPKARDSGRSWRREAKGRGRRAEGTTVGSRGGGSGDVARKESPVGSIGGRPDQTRAAPLLFRAEPLWPTG